ncbi:hypothetical protein [Amycolatopsis sp. lyj-109]|uniref:hypothetical protein n=1 Tax=Amycolatopsis sp. lyj-109 TaxID=2789287 RepID=UPI003978D6DF
MNSSSTRTGTTSSTDLFAFLKWVMSSRARSKDMRKLLCVAAGIAVVLIGALAVGVAASGLSSAAASVLCGAAGYGFRARRSPRHHVVTEADCPPAKRGAA